MNDERLTEEQRRILSDVQAIRADPTQDLKDLANDPAFHAGMRDQGEVFREAADKLTAQLNKTSEKLKPKGIMGWLIR